MLFSSGARAARMCRDPGSNRGPSDLQSDALPAGGSCLRVSARRLPGRPELRERLALFLSSRARTSHARDPGYVRHQLDHVFDMCLPRSKWQNVKAHGSDSSRGEHATPRGFEPLRAEPNGFRVHLLSRSDTVSLRCWRRRRRYRVQFRRARPRRSFSRGCLVDGRTSSR